jgi:hypothetical protein
MLPKLTGKHNQAHTSQPTPRFPFGIQQFLLDLEHKFAMSTSDVATGGTTFGKWKMH